MRRSTLSCRRGTAAAVLTLIACVALTTPSLCAPPEVADAVALADVVDFRILESTGTRTLIEILVPEPVTERISVEGQEYDLVSVPGAAPFGEPGEPLLAVAATMIAVPPAAGVSLRVVDETFETLGGYNLPPLSVIASEGDEPLW